MGMFGLILGVLGGLCAVMGILLAVGVEPLPITGVDETFWFSLAVISLLASLPVTASPDAR